MNKNQKELQDEPKELHIDRDFDYFDEEEYPNGAHRFAVCVCKKHRIQFENYSPDTVASLLKDITDRKERCYAAACPENAEYYLDFGLWGGKENEAE